MFRPQFSPARLVEKRATQVHGSFSIAQTIVASGWPLRCRGWRSLVLHLMRDFIGNLAAFEDG